MFAITWPNLDRFSKFFHCWTQNWISLAYFSTSTYFVKYSLHCQTIDICKQKLYLRINKMVFTYEDKVLIQNLLSDKRLWTYKTDKRVSWEKLDTARIRSVSQENTANRFGWPKEGEWQAEIFTNWRECIFSWRTGSESGRQPQNHRSIRQICRETGISRSSVHRIIHDDRYNLKWVKKRRACQRAVCWISFSFALEF